MTTSISKNEALATFQTKKEAMEDRHTQNEKLTIVVNRLEASFTKLFDKLFQKMEEQSVSDERQNGKIDNFEEKLANHTANEEKNQNRLNNSIQDVKNLTEKIHEKLDTKIDKSDFKWIIGGLVTAALIAGGFIWQAIDSVDVRLSNFEAVPNQTSNEQN